MKKHCFLTLFGEHNAESSKNAVFRKREKTLFCHTFLGNCRAKNSKTPFFSHFLRTLYKVSRKAWKNTVFSQFLLNVAQKAKKPLLFRIFCVTLNKVSQQTWINTVSSHFLGNVAQKAQKTFFAFFANFVKSVSKNVKKHCFLTLFAECRANS